MVNSTTVGNGEIPKTRIPSKLSSTRQRRRSRIIVQNRSRSWWAFSATDRYRPIGFPVDTTDPMPGCWRKVDSKSYHPPGTWLHRGAREKKGQRGWLQENYILVLLNLSREIIPAFDSAAPFQPSSSFERHYVIWSIRWTSRSRR